MVYPRRGEWTFRNIRRDFRFYPTLDTIEITQEHPDMSATLSCEVVADADAHPEYDFQVDDEVRFLFDGDRVFGGHLTTVTEDRVEEFGPRKWTLEAADFTAKLGDAIIRQREQRKKESALRRVRWVLSYLPHAWHLDGRDLEVPSEDLEREDMYGMSVAEALDSIANECGIRYWIDADNVIHVHKATTVDAPFALDNDAPNLTTSFPFREFTYTREGIDRRNAILVEPEKRKDSRWSVASANINDYEWGDSTGRREAFISEEEIRTARAAERHGDTHLQRSKVPKTEATLICFQPGLWSSMNVSLTEALWEHDQTMRIVKVVISAMDPHDDDDTAYLRSELTLTNKPKRRSPKKGRIEGETTDTGKHAVDRFDRTATPPTPTPGASFSVSIDQYTMHQQMVGTFSEGVYVPGTPTTPTLSPVSSVGPQFAIDKAGWYNHPHAGTGCGVGLGAQDGWYTQEFWRKVTIPAPPGGAEGFFVTVSAASATIRDAALSYPCYLHASLTEPAGLGAGTRIGAIAPSGSSTLYVPAGFAPAGGGDVWLGCLPGWFPPHGWSPGWFCYYDPPAFVALNGSRDGFPITAWAWATAAAPLDLGDASSDDKAPWGEQTWPWVVVGVE